MGNLFARLLGDGAAEVEKNAPFPVTEFLTLLVLVGLFVIFFSVITYGIVKSCRNGTCNKPVESG